MGRSAAVGGASIEAIIFDMDGLMFDTERVSLEAWQTAAREQSIELPEDLIIRSVGLDLTRTRELFCEALGYDFDFDRLHRRRVEIAAVILRTRGIPVKPGLSDLLRTISRGPFKTAVATSTRRERAVGLLWESKFISYFDAVVAGDEIRHGKPSPDIFLKAAERLAVAPRRCLVLEDSEAGIQAAARANMHRYMIPDIRPPSETARSLANRIFSDLNEVAALIEKATW